MMDPTAKPWTLRVLHPLRKVLPEWPAVLPSEIGDPVRPLKIGVHGDLVALLGPPPSDAHRIAMRTLRRYVSSHEYKAALAAEGSWRHALDGTPVEPVAAEHKPRGHSREVFVVVMKVKALKITVVLDPGELKPAPDGAAVVLRVTTPEGLYVTASLNPKSYRKAVEAIRRHGPENVAVVLQGRMVKLGELLDAGITVQEKKKPADPPAPPPRSGQLSLKAG